MSGHSKWHKIQHKKGANDAKRSNLFTKLTSAVTVAAQQGGGDPEMNFSLRLAIDRAKASNVPKDNIERAVKRGTGELKDGAVLQELMYEGFGPGGAAVLIEAVTDNSNRTVSEVKHVLGKFGGSLGGPGSVKWQFERKGVVRLGKEQYEDVKGNDDFELALMDAGAEEMDQSEFGLEVVCPAEEFQSVLVAVKSFNIETEDSGLEWVAKETVSLDDNVSAKLESLEETLDELDDVRDVYTNGAS